MKKIQNSMQALFLSSVFFMSCTTNHKFLGHKMPPIKNRYNKVAPLHRDIEKNTKRYP